MQQKTGKALNLPPIHNKRSPQQWEIISKRIDFKGKTVIDLGCGFGDILFRCWRAGAKLSAGRENDFSIFHELTSRLPTLEADSLQSGNKIHLLNCDIEEWITLRCDRNFDIAILFSVLPYLKEPALALQWMRIHSDISLIECQYFQDGPGFDFIKSDNDMQEWLEDVGWQSVEKIGKTLVESRDKERSIWLCR